MSSSTLWCIANKNNKFIHETLRANKEECIWALFDCMPEDFRTKYWKNLKGSRKAYKELGYRPVRVAIVSKAEAVLMRG